MKKLDCLHPDELVEFCRETEHHEGGGNDYDSTTYKSFLKCKGCGETSIPNRMSYISGGSHPPLDFGPHYRMLTGREWFTLDDSNQLNMLRKNPTLFWQFPPTNAKYLVPQVQGQWTHQEKLDELEKKRHDLLIEVRKLDAEINKTLTAAGRPTKYSSYGRY